MLIKTALRLFLIAAVWLHCKGQIMSVSHEVEHNLVYQILVPAKDFRVIGQLTGPVLHSL